MQIDDEDYNAPIASSSTASQPYTQRLLASILPPGAPADEHYESRLKDKKVQLSNPDRRRPRPSDGDDGEGKSHAAVKLAKRQKRASRVLRKPKTSAKEEGPAAAASLAPPSRRRQAHRGIADLDSDTSYAALLPLHHFWTSYIQQFLNLVRLDSSTQRWQPNPALILSQPPAKPQWRLTDSAIAHAQQQICKADLVGGLLRVTRASNPALVGIEGILAKETEHTVVLASKGDPTAGPKSKKASRIFKVVPKHNAVFVVRVPLPVINGADASAAPTAHLEMPLQGNQMEGQMVTRATRKWKQKRTMDF